MGTPAWCRHTAAGGLRRVSSVLRRGSGAGQSRRLAVVSPWSAPNLPVEGAELDGLGDVFGSDPLAAREVGNRP